MKRSFNFTILITLICMLLIYCGQQSSHDSSGYNTKENLGAPLNNSVNESDIVAQFITESYFIVKCPCELIAMQKAYNHTTIWGCYTNDSITFYSVQLEDFKKLLSPYDNTVSVRNEVDQLLTSRLNEIKAIESNYFVSYLYGFPGFAYELSKRNNIIEKIQVIAAGNFIYTISVSSDSILINNLFDSFVSSFEMSYSSKTHNYIIEIPKGFFIDTETVGPNVDLKLRDQVGNTIVVVVKKLQPEERITIAELKEISNESWEQNLQMPNVKIKQKGDIYINRREGMSLYYTSKHDFEKDNSFYMNYFFVVKDKLYVVTARANELDIHSIQREFLRALSSFVIK